METQAKRTVAKKGQRSCIVCGCKDAKRGLLRFVKSPDGQVSFDPTGRAAGRGAYVCSAECLRTARKGRLEHALKTKLDQQEFERLEAEVALKLRGAQGIVEE